MADVADFDGLVDRLIELGEDAERLESSIEAAMDEWPKAPGQVNSARASAGQVRAALQRGIHRVNELTALAEAREQRMSAHAEERKYDKHTKDMAERMGITPDAFLELQEQRRREMRSAPGTVTYAPDHEVVR